MNKTNKQINGKNALFTCDVCEQSFSYKYNLIHHLKTHDGDYKTRKKYQCKICDLEYCEYRVLLNHVRNTHFNFEGKVSFYKDKLVNETWVERVKRTGICVEMTKIADNVIAIKRCSQSNSNMVAVEADFKNTERTMSDDAYGAYSRVVCHYCNKEMRRKSLANHIRERHLNIKRFNCETCGHNFNRHYQLVNHVCGKYKLRPRRKT